MQFNPSVYRGRFAPSPSGPLHFGSLVTAIASYLDAKANGGQWFVRIEDIDTPRIKPHATNSILSTLARYQLHWDGLVIYQSQRNSFYKGALHRLRLQNQLYSCQCSLKERKLKKQVDQHYCRNQIKSWQEGDALCFRCSCQVIHFEDAISGSHSQQLGPKDDFTLYRKEHLWAYHLAVCVDDQQQKITHVVRGEDLLACTAQQVALLNALGYPLLTYAHVPLITDSFGKKISKSEQGEPLSQEEKAITHNWYKALCALYQAPPPNLQQKSKKTLIAWAINNWNLQKLAANSQSMPN